MRILSHSNNIEFARFLLFNLRRLLSKSISVGELKPWTDFFKSKNIDVDAITLYRMACNNLVITKDDSGYIIEFNKNILYNNIKMITLLKMIDYGCLEKRKSTVFSKIFNEVQNGLNRYAILYGGPV